MSSSYSIFAASCMFLKLKKIITRRTRAKSVYETSLWSQIVPFKLLISLSCFVWKLWRGDQLRLMQRRRDFFMSFFMVLMILVIASGFIPFSSNVFSTRGNGLKIRALNWLICSWTFLCRWLCLELVFFLYCLYCLPVCIFWCSFVLLWCFKSCAIRHFAFIAR